MTPEAWVIFLATHQWVLRVMVVAALVTTVGALYAVATYVERIWSKRPRQNKIARDPGQVVVPGLRCDLKCGS